jgi:hypothetical protein
MKLRILAQIVFGVSSMPSLQPAFEIDAHQRLQERARKRLVAFAIVADRRLLATLPGSFKALDSVFNVNR